MTTTTTTTTTTWSQALALGAVEWLDQMFTARLAAGMSQTEAVASVSASLRRMAQAEESA